MGRTDQGQTKGPARFELGWLSTLGVLVASAAGIWCVHWRGNFRSAMDYPWAIGATLACATAVLFSAFAFYRSFDRKPWASRLGVVTGMALTLTGVGVLARMHWEELQARQEMAHLDELTRPVAPPPVDESVVSAQAHELLDAQLGALGKDADKSWDAFLAAGGVDLPTMTSRDELDRRLALLTQARATQVRFFKYCETSPDQLAKDLLRLGASRETIARESAECRRLVAEQPELKAARRNSTRLLDTSLAYLSTLRANWGVWSVDRTTGALVVGDLPVREGRRLAGLAARVERMMSTGPGQASVEGLEAPDDDTPSRAR